MEQSTADMAASPSVNNRGLALRGVAEIFYNPTKFLGRLKDDPKVLIPYVLLVIMVVIFMYSTSDFMLKAQLESPRLQQQLQGQTLPPGQLKLMKTMTLVMGSLALSLTPLFAALLGMFWGNFVFGGEARFKQVLSVMLYGEIIYVVGILLLLPMIFAKQSMLVTLSPAILVASKGLENPLYVALSKIGIFNIWEIIVVGIGLSILYKVSRNKGYLLSVLSMGMLSVMSVLIAIITA